MQTGPSHQLAFLLALLLISATPTGELQAQPSPESKPTIAAPKQDKPAPGASSQPTQPTKSTDPDAEEEEERGEAGPEHEAAAWGRRIWRAACGGSFSG